MSAAQSVAAVHGLKLNIGCGLSGIPGWYNIDNSPTVLLSRLPMGQRLFRTPQWPRDVRRINVLHGLPFFDESVLYIYSSHLLQGLKPAESRGLLRECFRVLQPGGVLRIVVPDLERVVRDYLADPDTAASHKLMRRLSPKSSPIRDLLRKGRRYEQMFDARSLAELLAEAGFNDPRRCGFKQSRIAEIDAIEVERRRSESLCVEASK